MSKKQKNKLKTKKLVPYHYKPDNLSLEQWQKALREQFAYTRHFGLEKLDDSRVFGDYRVYNPEKHTQYKVALRSYDDSLNFCECMDFKTNHLGTCKHIEAVKKHILSKKKDTEIFKKGIELSYTSVYLNYKGERKVKIRIGSYKKKDFQDLAAEYFNQNLELKDDAFMHFEKFIKHAKALSSEFRCYDDAMDFILTTRENKRRKQQIKQIYPDSQQINGVLKTQLYPYQKEGILFALEQGRCMIADEMGLGKTIQAIGVAEILKKELLISNVLIVCPTSLKYQWQSEIEKFAGRSVKVIEGPPDKRKEQYLSSDFYKIVSYHTLKNDVIKANASEIDLVILDEAQRIKNWRTQLAQGVKKIVSRYSLVLTGTPLENKLEELYSIVQFIDPYKLGPYHKFLDYHQIKDEKGRVVGYQHLNEVGDLLSDIMIRRKKDVVYKQLPERVDKNLLVPMTDEQMDLHDFHQSVVARLVHKWKMMRFLNEQDRQKLMINLNMMRMSCNSTYIIDQTTRNDTKIDELINILEEYFDGTREKAVIFSQWERMTRIVAGELKERGIEFEYLHGGVPSAKRKHLFENFNANSDTRVFISTDAGSTGLNLQTASLVINLDIPWNPAVLEQRIGRIHRIGQQNKITVLNFISKDTIEHKMLDVLAFKSSLAKGILDQGSDTIFLSESKFNQFMKTVDNLVEEDEKADHERHTLSKEEKTEQLELSFKEKSDSAAEKTESVSKPESQGRAKHKEGEVAPEALISQGVNFLSGLADALSSPEKTEELVSSITEKDQKSGKTYIKIPVEDNETVTKAFNLFGQLLKNLGKQ